MLYSNIEPVIGTEQYLLITGIILFLLPPLTAAAGELEIQLYLA